MTAASKAHPLLKLPCRDTSVGPTRIACVKADDSWEGTGTRTRGTPRGRGPGAWAGRAGITSGKTMSQPGLAATGKDYPIEAEAEGGWREMVWRMSPYELRGRGNALRGGARHRPGQGNTVAGQRGSGHLAVRRRRGSRTQSRDLPFSEGRTSTGGKPSGERGGCEPALEPRRRWGGTSRRGQGQNRTRESRPSGIAGGPRETWPWWNCEPTSQSKERGWKPSAYSARARVLSRPST
jgi:hypothetical protein